MNTDKTRFSAEFTKKKKKKKKKKRKKKKSQNEKMVISIVRSGLLCSLMSCTVMKAL